MNAYREKKVAKLKMQSKKKCNYYPHPPANRFNSFQTEISCQSNKDVNSIANRLYNEVLDLKPFSILDQQKGLEDKLNQLFTIHRRKSQGNHSSQKTSKLPYKIKNLRQQCIEILNKNRIKKRKNKSTDSHQLIKIKRPQDSYDDIQNELASQLINQSKKQKKLFQSTINKFQKIIEDAQIKYINKNQLDFTPKDIKEFGLRKIGNRDRVCTQYQDYYEITDAKFINSFLNKKDVHTWLRSSRKLVNSAENNQQNLPQTFKKQLKMAPLIKNGNDVLYKRYFKKNSERKSILTSSPQAL